MKRVIVAVAVVAVAVAIVLLWKSRGGHDDAARAPAGSATASGSAIAPGGQRTRKVDHATRITPDEHRDLVAQIAAAQAAHASHVASPAAPKLPEQDDLALVKDNVQAAMKAAIPFLAACYDAEPATGALTATAMMTLTADPDIGTVIDADQIYDDKHQPLSKRLDDCLRNTMQTLALPPLDADTKIRVEYSFRFDHDK